MSSEQSPPRKKQKSEPTTSRVLRSQSSIQQHRNEVEIEAPSAPTPARISKTTRSSKKSMSESRRRSSRKSRNDELRDNEQNVAAGSASAKASPSSRQSSRRVYDTPVKDKSYSKDIVDEDMDYEDDYEEEGDNDEILGEDEVGTYRADQEQIDNDEVQGPIKQDRSQSSFRAGSLGLGAMASLLSNHSATLKSLLASLREPDPSIQLMALNELANMLSMSTEDSLAGYLQTDAFVVELVKIMRGPNAFGEENPEMMLLACRCLANMMEALPSSTGNIAYGGAVPVLCQKLLEIQYIDLAEQALSTLEKISKDYPASVVREGGLGACLTYLDFFSTNVQRTAVNTAANCARNIPYDSFPVVRDVIPTLQNVIQGSDSKVVEAACLCLTRIVESFKSDRNRLEEILKPDLMRTIFELLSPVKAGGNTVSEFIHTRFLHSLGLAAKASAKLATQMMKHNLIGTIYQLLTGLAIPTTVEAIRLNSVVVLQALIHRPRDQVAEILSLISEILPGLPQHDLFKGLSEREHGAQDERGRMFVADCLAQFEHFATIVLPTLLDIYNSTVNSTLRKTSLVALLKLCYNLDTRLFKRVVSDVSLAVFITGVLGAQDLELVLCGSAIALILLDRVPEVYIEKLGIEGCVTSLKDLETKYANVATAEADIHEDLSIVNESEDNTEYEDEDQYTEDGFDDEIDLEEDEDNEESADHHASTGAILSPSTDSSVPPVLESPLVKRSSVILGRLTAEFIHKYTALNGGNYSKDKTFEALEQVAADIDHGNITQAFDELSNLFEGDREVSSYYLRSSGILNSLLAALTGESKLINRQVFLARCMSTKLFKILVAKLQESLSIAEKFEVTTTSSSDEKRSASVLAKQLRLKLVAEEGSEISRGYKALTVSVHAIATFKALDDYLRPRVMSSGLGRSGQNAASNVAGSSGMLRRAPDGLQGALAQLAAAGSSLPESLRARLAGLGVDTSALLNIAGPSGSAPKVQIDAERLTGEDDEEAGPPVSIEVPASGGRAIAKTAEGKRIVTPRTGTPNVSPNKADGDKVHEGSQIAHKAQPKQGTMSYAAAVSSVPKDWHLQFEVNGVVIPHETTIYGAVSTTQAVGDASTHGRPLSSVYLVKFRKVQGPAPVLSQPSASLPTLGQVPSSIEQEREAAPILQLLDVLHALNTNWKDLYTDKANMVVQSLDPVSFLNTKLTAKLNRQLEEPLIVASQCLPGWSQDLPRFYPFLFPFETRYLFLQSTSFGYSRSMTRWQSAAKKDRDDGRPFLGRLQRHRVRVSRSHMLESAIKVMNIYGANPSILEVEYFDEVGTGLGPTLEFYSTVSKELSKRKLNLWRDNDSSAGSEYVFASAGLFPQPIGSVGTETSSESTKRTIALFKTLGTFIARSMLDSRMIDISFNPAFFRLLGDSSDLPASIGAIYGIDKALAKSLSLVKKFSDAFEDLAKNTEMADEIKIKESRKINFDDVMIEDLGLDFTYPGSPGLELIPGGSQVDVTCLNVSDYLSRVVDLTVGSGIQRQLDAFKDGFSHVFPYGALRAFTPAELTMIFGHSEEDWSISTVLESLKADHGYTMDSSTIQNLAQVLSELSDTDRRKFLQFITGSPKLPIGGFKSLTPQFTVVCKPHEAPLTADDYLPSVMTCVNYLKMPDYSSIGVLRQKLMTAMNEGGGSFHLS